MFLCNPANLSVVDCLGSSGISIKCPSVCLETPGAEVLEALCCCFTACGAFISCFKDNCLFMFFCSVLFFDVHHFYEITGDPHLVNQI